MIGPTPKRTEASFEVSVCGALFAGWRLGGIADGGDNTALLERKCHRDRGGVSRTHGQHPGLRMGWTINSTEGGNEENVCSCLRGPGKCQGVVYSLLGRKD